MLIFIAKDPMCNFRGYARGLSIYSLPDESFADRLRKLSNFRPVTRLVLFMIAQNPNYSNSAKENAELASITHPTTEEKCETSLEILAEVAETALDAVEENATNRWMEIAAPILKSGGKTVSIILALGFISIPLMITGSPWVPLVLAIGASVTAICSCLR